MEEQPNRCPACDTAVLEVFYGTGPVPVHSVLLMPTREQARAYPHGEIRLGFCRRCGMVTNTSFDPSRLEYSPAYEETQGFSPTFRDFQRRLVDDLIQRHGLSGKRILEIGCGKGQFLSLLCELGGNRGIGYDPSYVAERVVANVDVEFVPELYGEETRPGDVDFVCCRMTLEHIQPVARFVSMLHQTLTPASRAVIFFQVPDFERILRECAFWDIYYEHCSYFTRASLGRLFRRCGFKVTKMWTDYDGQYLMLEAQSAATPADDAVEELEELESRVQRFAVECRASVRRWADILLQARRERRRVVLWGAGSKAVAFLAAADPEAVVDYAVDINPHKQGTFLPGGGQEIVAPAFLRDYRPHLVIVMNPIYRQEVSATLDGLGLECEVLCV